MHPHEILKEVNTNLEALHDAHQGARVEQLATFQASVAEGFKVLEASVAALAGKTLTVKEEPAPKTLLTKIMPWLAPGLVLADILLNFIR